MQVGFCGEEGQLEAGSKGIALEIFMRRRIAVSIIWPHGIWWGPRGGWIVVIVLPFVNASFLILVASKLGLSLVKMVDQSATHSGAQRGDSAHRAGERVRIEERRINETICREERLRREARRDFGCIER